MHADLKAVMGAIGPSSALIFASWIFMGFLQQRYTAADERYRALISEYRDGQRHDDRQGNVRDQVILYKRRCELMRTAANIGLVAAIFLIAALVCAGIDAVLGGAAPLSWVGTGCALAGLVLVAVAACFVIRENAIIQRAIDGELLDVPELAGDVGQKAGNIRKPGRRAQEKVIPGGNARDG